MTAMNDQIIFDNVSKFYGEVLGVNRISLNIRSGRHHAGRPQRIGQDDADEPDDGAGAAFARIDFGAGTEARRMRPSSSAKWATARSSIRSRAGSPGGNS